MLDSKKIPLSQGQFATVDADNYEHLNQRKWYARKKGRRWYAYCHDTDKRKQGKIAMHRVVIGAQKGELVDHINGDGIDNRKSNLRICTNSQNMRNRGKQKNNTTGYKGVTWSGGRRKWLVRVEGEGKRIHVGYFSCLIKAAKAYDEAAKIHYGEFARLNFPLK